MNRFAMLLVCLHYPIFTPKSNSIPLSSPIFELGKGCLVSRILPFPTMTIPDSNFWMFVYIFWSGPLGQTGKTKTKIRIQFLEMETTNRKWNQIWIHVWILDWKLEWNWIFEWKWNSVNRPWIRIVRDSGSGKSTKNWLTGRNVGHNKFRQHSGSRKSLFQ